MRLPNTGGRDFADRNMMRRVLDKLNQQHGFTLLFHGDAQGAERMSGERATQRGIETLVCPADWKTHGRAAGSIRNRYMLTKSPETVVAFPAGGGRPTLWALLRMRE